jgi:hypothetical protein
MAGDGELAKLESVYRPLAESVRRVIDATIRTQVDDVTLAAAREKIDCAVNYRADVLVWSEFNLGAPYEGPPGHVHGGVCAMVLDHVLGATAHRPGKPAYTGTLRVRFLRGTPLGPLRAEVRVDRVEGVKTFCCRPSLQCTARHRRSRRRVLPP